MALSLQGNTMLPIPRRSESAIIVILPPRFRGLSRKPPSPSFVLHFFFFSFLFLFSFFLPLRFSCLLFRMFRECPHPDEKQRLQLSRELGLAPRQIKFWFQNRRTQMKVPMFSCVFMCPMSPFASFVPILNY